MARNWEWPLVKASEEVNPDNSQKNDLGSGSSPVKPWDDRSPADTLIAALCETLKQRAQLSCTLITDPQKVDTVVCSY